MRYIIIGMIKDGHKIVGYRIKGTNGQMHDMTKDEIVNLVENGSIINAKIQWYNGSAIVRTKEKIPVCARIIKPKQEKQTTGCDTSIEDTKEHELEESKEIKVYSGNEIVDLLSKMEKGTPLKMTCTSKENYKQCLYVGKERTPLGLIEHTFFDGSGLSGLFKFSERFMVNNSKTVKITIDDNDAVEVTRLIQKARG